MTVLDRYQIESSEVCVREALDEIRPFLEADGGNITLEEVTQDGIAMVRLHGACCNCSMSAMTLKAGVEEAIKKSTPEVRSVQAVNAELVA